MNAENNQQVKHPCGNCGYAKQCGVSTRTEPCNGRVTKEMLICKTRTHGVGEVSSKYGYDRDGKQFEADIQKHFEDGERLYAEFVEWMKTKEVVPDKFRSLFMRYYKEFVE